MYNEFKIFNLSKKGVLELATIGDRLKFLRTSHNLSQEEFGKQFGIVKSTVSLYENGKSTPDDQTKIKICQHYKVSMDWLYGLGQIQNAEFNDKSCFIFDFSFSERLDSLMKDSHISAEMLSQKTGLPLEQIDSVRNGIPDLKALIVIADYFHVSIDYLLCRTDKALLSKDEEDLLLSYNKCNDDCKRYLKAKAEVLCIEGISAVAASEVPESENSSKKSYPSSGTEGIA